MDTVDEYLTTLEFENGCIAQMENGWITPNANPCVNDIKCNILGTEGMVAIDASNHNLVQLYHRQEGRSAGRDRAKLDLRPTQGLCV